MAPAKRCDKITLFNFKKGGRYRNTEKRKLKNWRQDGTGLGLPRQLFTNLVNKTVCYYC